MRSYKGVQSGRFLWYIIFMQQLPGECGIYKPSSCVTNLGELGGNVDGSTQVPRSLISKRRPAIYYTKIMEVSEVPVLTNLRYGCD